MTEDSERDDGRKKPEKVDPKPAGRAKGTRLVIASRSGRKREK